MYVCVVWKIHFVQLLIEVSNEFFFQNYFSSNHMKYEPGNLRPRGPPSGGWAACAAAAAAILMFNWFIILGLRPKGPCGCIMGLAWKKNSKVIFFVFRRYIHLVFFPITFRNIVFCVPFLWVWIDLFIEMFPTSFQHLLKESGLKISKITCNLRNIKPWYHIAFKD